MEKMSTPCIFVADDNPNNLKVLSSMLEAKGYDVRVALDGAQAFASIENAPPDLILLDIHMPKMDGYEVCTALKNNLKLKEIPVIFISALSESFNKILGFQKGAVDYIEKPFHIEEVEARVETQLKLQYYQKRLKEKIKSSEERLVLATEAGCIGVWEWRILPDILVWDKRMFTFFGLDRDAFNNKYEDWLSLVHEEDRKHVDEEIQLSLADQVSFETEFRIIRPDGSIGYLSARADVHPGCEPDEKRMIGVCQDITERVLAEKKRKDMEMQLRQAQKMEAIGTLAGGIAHDFNNILGVMIGYTQIAQMELPEGSPVEENLASVMTAANRAKELVSQVLTYCRKTEQKKKRIKIQPIVKETLHLLRASLPATIEIKSRVDKCCPVLADSTQIHQVLMNLCTNAFHAMDRTGGVLTVALHMMELPEITQIDDFILSPGRHVILEVSDTGTGITPHLIERIYEPYFTTKSKNKGTGLGLSVVHGIVKNHGGAISVCSEEGKGASFKVYLPCVEEKTDARENIETGLIPKGNEKILLVDDDKFYLAMLKEMLSSLGYHVTATLDSSSVMELIKNDPHEFKCLITDMTMPGITGLELAGEVLSQNNHLPVILLTGFNRRVDKTKAMEMGIKAFLMKPVILSEMAEALRAVLDE